MKCDQVQINLPEYRDGSLAPEQVHCIEEHLKNCEACADYFRQEEQLSASFRTVASHLESRVQFHFERDRSPKLAYRRWYPEPLLCLKWGMTLLVVGLLVVSILYLYHPFSSHPLPYNQVAGSKTGGMPQREEGASNEQGDGIIEIITIKNGHGCLLETCYRQDEGGITSEISVQVTAIKVLGKEKG